MRIQELKEGQVIKNYKELCEVLGEKPKVGKSKQLQLKKFDRYFEYTREGNKYIITKIYDKKKKKEDNRGGNNKVYVEDFERLMIYNLYKDKSEMKLLSKNAIFKLMDLCNDNYIVGRGNISKLSELLEVPKKSIYEFYDTNGGKLLGVVERNLKALRSKSLITYENVMCVAKEEVTIATNELNEPIIYKGDLVKNINTVYREATKEERQIIIKYEEDIKRELGAIDNKEVYLKGKWKEYKNKVEKKLCDSGMNIKYYFDSYRITYNHDRIERAYKELELDSIVEQDIKNDMNSKVVKSCEKSIKTRHTKSMNKIDKTQIDMFRGLDTYVNEQIKLTNELIDNKATILKSELKKEVDYIKLSKINNINTMDNKEVEVLEFSWDLDSILDNDSNIPF